MGDFEKKKNLQACLYQKRTIFMTTAGKKEHGACSVSRQKACYTEKNILCIHMSQEKQFLVHVSVEKILLVPNHPHPKIKWFTSKLKFYRLVITLLILDYT